MGASPSQHVDIKSDDMWLLRDAPSDTCAGRMSAGCLARERSSDFIVSSLAAERDSVTHPYNLRWWCNRRGGAWEPLRSLCLGPYLLSPAPCRTCSLGLAIPLRSVITLPLILWLPRVLICGPALAPQPRSLPLPECPAGSRVSLAFPCDASVQGMPFTGQP